MMIVLLLRGFKSEYPDTFYGSANHTNTDNHVDPEAAEVLALKSTHCGNTDNNGDSDDEHN